MDRLPDAQVFIDTGGYKEEDFLAEGAPSDPLGESSSQKLLGKLFGIGDGRRTADELRLRSIEAADPFQPSQDIGHMRTEHSPVGMKLINHHKSQVLKKGHPLCMVRKDARVEHVRIGNDDISLRTNRLTGIGRCISVIGEGSKGLLNLLNQVLEFDHLILGKGFCGKSRRFCEAWRVYVQYGKIVTEVFPKRWGHHHHILSLRNGLNGILRE
jgi:hypothetical protein